MGRALVCDEGLRAVDDYLRSYEFYRKLLRLDRYERRYFGYEDEEETLPGDLTLARMKMYEVRHFVMNMKNSDEKLMLYYHYIRGETVEKCGELLGISRSSAFRLKKRALELAFTYLQTTK